MRHSLAKTLFLCALPFAVACTTAPAAPVKSPEGGAPTDTAKAGDGAPVRVSASDDPGIVMAIPTRYAWSIGPGESWTISIYQFVRSEGTKNVLKGPDDAPEFSIPGAFTRPALPARSLAKGAPVLVPDQALDERTTLCGRVTSTSPDLVKVAILGLHNEPEEYTFDLDQVLPLDGKLGFGAPVAFKRTPDEKLYAPGVLVRIDERHAWLQSALRVAASDVKAIDVGRTHKVGDKVLVVPDDGSGRFTPVTITAVIGDGLAYAFQNKDGTQTVVDYCSVTSAL
ncbi:hypothetical protein [Polyangium sorediatum]|uniref:Secreted protein n=1 Tax=Polyangium sorediatum TaxID=889274 RepID=A0ABT6NSQ0_9BACT|nr:hypothetical protein [Polyangium sorediatum]MDI1431308.1 hypothetical protein [Polyangium sorediatum]